MKIINYREGPQSLKYWRDWKKSVRRKLQETTLWALGRANRESMGGIAIEPINYPHFEDELVIFPRGIDMREMAALINHPERLKPEYEKRLRALVGNFNAKGRGKYTFLILPQTFEKILRQIEKRNTKITSDVTQSAIEYYYKGKRNHEVDSKITIRTLTSYLQRAEKELDILGDRRGELILATRTLDTTYTALRYGREAGIDFRRYFKNRIF